MIHDPLGSKISLSYHLNTIFLSFPAARTISESRSISECAEELILHMGSQPSKIAGGEAEWAILAGLRFVLALIVLSYHATFMREIPFLIQPLLPLGATIAVLCFFVISGYSIAHSIVREPKNFYTRRLKRLYPLYLSSLILSLIPFRLWGAVITIPEGGQVRNPEHAWDVIGSAFFLQGLACHRLDINSPQWSLGAEVLYYACAPLLVRLRTRWILAIGAVSVASFELISRVDISNALYGKAALQLAWVWLLGFLAYRHKGRPWLLALLLLPGLALLPNYDINAPQSCLLWGITCVTLLVAPHLTLSARLIPFLLYLGELSYALYVSHSPMLFIIRHIWHGRHVSADMVLCLLTAMLLYHLIDVPIRKRRRKREILTGAAAPRVQQEVLIKPPTQ